MRERYDDTDLKVLKNVLVEIVVLTTRRPELKNFLRGKELFLRGEIDRELKLREDERKAAEAAQAVPEPIEDDPLKNENPPT